MTYEKICSGIGLTQEQCQAAEAGRIGGEEYRKLKQLFLADRQECFAAIGQEERFRQKYLYFFLRLALDAHEDYQKYGIDDTIYFDTFRDIKIWSDNCKRDHGEAGLDHSNWLSLHVRLLLFRLGRLQFQPEILDEDLHINGRIVKKGERILNLHIPQGEPLDYGTCLDSLSRCRTFFKEPYQEIICYSWLLCPTLKQLLRPESNILRFQSLFEIFDTNSDSRQAEERVFGTISDNPRKYPETTGLQRSMKNWLLMGNKVGSAGGRIKDLTNGSLVV